MKSEFSDISLPQDKQTVDNARSQFTNRLIVFDKRVENFNKVYQQEFSPWVNEKLSQPTGDNKVGKQADKVLRQFSTVHSLLENVEKIKNIYLKIVSDKSLKAICEKGKIILIITNLFYRRLW